MTLTLTFQGHCRWPWNGAVEFPIYNLLLLSDSNNMSAATHFLSFTIVPQFLTPDSNPFHWVIFVAMKLSLPLVGDKGSHQKWIWQVLNFWEYFVYRDKPAELAGFVYHSGFIVSDPLGTLTCWRHPCAAFNGTHASPVCKGRSAHTAATFRNADRPLWLVRPTSLR